MGVWFSHIHKVLILSFRNCSVQKLLSVLFQTRCNLPYPQTGSMTLLKYALLMHFSYALVYHAIFFSQKFFILYLV